MVARTKILTLQVYNNILICGKKIVSFFQLAHFYLYLLFVLCGNYNDCLSLLDFVGKCGFLFFH